MNSLDLLRKNPSISRSGYRGQMAYSPGILTQDPEVMKTAISSFYARLQSSSPHPPLINIFGFHPPGWGTTQTEKFLESLLPGYVAIYDDTLYQLRPQHYVDYYVSNRS